jgi:hypothetical protein
VRRLVTIVAACSLIALACRKTTAPTISVYEGVWTELTFTSAAGCGGFCGGFNNVAVLNDGSFQPGGSDSLYNVVAVIDTTGHVRGTVVWDNVPVYTTDSLVGLCPTIESCAGSVIGGFPSNGAAVTFSMSRPAP